MIRRVAAAHATARFAPVGEGRNGRPDALADLGPRLLVTGPLPHERNSRVAALAVGGAAGGRFLYRCPLKLVEWMAAGRAVVAPRHEPIAELIEDGVDGRCPRTTRRRWPKPCWRCSPTLPAARRWAPPPRRACAPA
ncbi:MAG: glycosyltransferase [Candidatus Binatia bacterium]